MGMGLTHMDQDMADRMITRAVLFAADKKFDGDADQALTALRRGRCEVCDFLSYSLVRQIGEYLGQIDRTVKAVYVFKAEKGQVMPATSPTTAGRRASGINLIAWVDRKSPALSLLGNTLEVALTESRRKIGCERATPACGNLGIYMVDDHEVQEGRGFGAIVQSMYVRSLQVWARVDEILQPGAELDFGDAISSQDLLTTFNPEVAPEELLFEQARAIEKMPAEAQAALYHRLQEEKVVLIRRMISDQLAYINIAKDWFSVSDLLDIRRRKTGEGKIGGKAAGLLLAERILQDTADENLRLRVCVPKSFFLGSDLIYVFMSANGLVHWNDQKYKTAEQMRADYPRICEDFQAGAFPPDIEEKLQEVLDALGPCPLIVRSSSQLEDNFGTSFAGKYDSHFCPNQGSRRENLRALTRAIASTYASTLKPEALLYRRSKNLQDYDERMAILIQEVQGEKHGRYYLPHAAGVAFSRNLYRWSPEIRREDGFVRMVWGLGTRAVDRVSNDYPRLVALSHPNLQPDDSPHAIRYYSQQYVDLIDLEENTFKTLPVHEVLQSNYGPLRYLAQIESEGYFSPIRTRVSSSDLPRLAITFSEFLRRTPFAETIQQVLRQVEQHYHSAVDMEFTAHITDPFAARPEVVISVLQCRPQAHLQDGPAASLPDNLDPAKIILSTRYMVPQGCVTGLRYVVFVQPEAYFALPTVDQRMEVGRTIGRLNGLLPAKSFICVGPGRWGTNNSDLGVFVCYADIYQSAALVELSGRGVGPAPEPSLGTHFFQDLMEAQIYPLALLLDSEGTTFNRPFFYEAPNSLGEVLPEAANLAPVVRLIDTSLVHPGLRLDLVMDDEKGQAAAFFR